MTTTIVRKAVMAAIEPGDDDETSPTGSFHIILSAPTKDRDGETLLPDEWKTPLPPYITMDRDHEMSVAGTVGSGVPTIEADGALHVRGTYSSLPMAQDVRTLVREKHIRQTSVAFMRESAVGADGKKKVSRELLNGAFVAVPANPDALVLSSKAAGLKVGRRNSGEDASKIQAIHDSAAALGADCAAGKAAARKDADTEDAADPGALAQGVDAAIDSAIDLFAQVDATTLPEAVQQGIALIQGADAAVDELLDALGVPDPDEDNGGTDPASATAAAAKAAAAEAEAELAVRALALRAQIALSDTAQKG